MSQTMSKTTLEREREVILSLLACFGRMSRSKLMKRSIWMLSDRLRKQRVGILRHGKRPAKAYGIEGSDWKIGELILEGIVFAENVNGEQNLYVSAAFDMAVTSEDRERLREIDAIEKCEAHQFSLRKQFSLRSEKSDLSEGPQSGKQFLAELCSQRGRTKSGRVSVTAGETAIFNQGGKSMEYLLQNVGDTQWIDEAKRFSLEDAETIIRTTFGSHCWMTWSVDQIEQSAKRTVDIQDLRKLDGK